MHASETLEIRITITYNSLMSFFLFFSCPWGPSVTLGGRCRADREAATSAADMDGDEAPSLSAPPPLVLSCGGEGAKVFNDMQKCLKRRAESCVIHSIYIGLKLINWPRHLYFVNCDLFIIDLLKNYFYETFVYTGLKLLN